MSHYKGITIKKAYRIAPEFLGVLEALIAHDRERAEKGGACKNRSPFCYAPFNRHQFALMVEVAKRESANPLLYLEGMIVGWFIGYSRDVYFRSSLAYGGYTYVRGHSAGSTMLHHLEDATFHDLHEKGDRILPDYLHVDGDALWHAPAHCDECEALVIEQHRFLGSR